MCGLVLSLEIVITNCARWSKKIEPREMGWKGVDWNISAYHKILRRRSCRPIRAARSDYHPSNPSISPICLHIHGTLINEVPHLGSWMLPCTMLLHHALLWQAFQWDSEIRENHGDSWCIWTLGRQGRGCSSAGSWLWDLPAIEAGSDSRLVLNMLIFVDL